MTPNMESAPSGEPCGRLRPPPSRDSVGYWWIAVFVIALLLRAGWGIYRFSVAADSAALEFDDEQQYWNMAQSFRAGAGLQDELGFLATRMPLYPAALSLVVKLPYGVGVAKVCHWIIGAAAAALSAGMASAFFGRRVGILAGLLVAFDPFLVFFSSLLLTESAFVATLVGLTWAMFPLLRGHGDSLGRWVLVGLLASLTVYVRESGLGLVLVLLGFVALCRRFDRRSLIGTACVLGIVIAALFPWALRNKRILGEWCWLTTRGGLSLYDGVGPQATGESNLGNVKQMPAVQGKNEAEWNRYFLDKSVEAIRDDPGRILRLAGVKVTRMWNPLPNVKTYQSPFVRVVSVAWMLPLFLSAIVGTVLLWRSGPYGPLFTLFMLLPGIYLTLLHSLFVGSIRYRLGAMPMLEILAAVAVVSLLEYGRGGVTTEEPNVTG